MPANHALPTCGKVLDLTPSLPFVWPEARVLAKQSGYTENPPWQSIVAEASSFFGIVHGIDAKGVQWLTGVLNSSQDVRFRLLIAIYPACPTESTTLGQLRSFPEAFSDRAEFRLLLADRDEERPSNLLCVLRPNEARPVFLVGPSGNLGLKTPTTSQVNLAFQGDGELLEQYRNWFNYVWCECAVPLQDTTAAIPTLVPAQGDPDAESLWKEYCHACQPEGGQANDGELTVKVDPKTGETTMAGDALVSGGLPTDAINVPPADKASRQLTEIVNRGSLATIDRGSRIPPFSCPIKPEWFGITSSSQFGSITQTTGLRVSVMDEKTLKRLDGVRNKTRGLLTQLSFAWAEGLRWIPSNAKPLLEREIERFNKEGLTLLDATVDKGVDWFVESQRAHITEAASSLYHTLHSDKELPQDVVGKILEESKKRLEKASRGQLLAKLCYTPIQIGMVEESRWTTPLGPVPRVSDRRCRVPTQMLHG